MIPSARPPTLGTIKDVPSFTMLVLAPLVSHNSVMFPLQPIIATASPPSMGRPSALTRPPSCPTDAAFTVHTSTAWIRLVLIQDTSPTHPRYTAPVPSVLQALLEQSPSPVLSRVAATLTSAVRPAYSSP